MMTVGRKRCQSGLTGRPRYHLLISLDILARDMLNDYLISSGNGQTNGIDLKQKSDKRKTRAKIDLNSTRIRLTSMGAHEKTKLMLQSRKRYFRK